MYGHNLGIDVLPEATLSEHLPSLKGDLEQWRLTLPETLQLVSSTELAKADTEIDRAMGRFRTILTLRYHNLSLFIHRPLLCTALEHFAEYHMLETFSPSADARAGVHACVASAMEMIDIPYSCLTDPEFRNGVLGAWWFTLYALLLLEPY